MSMFSPPRREKAPADTSYLPKGDCRYILLHPENKGLRCACVGFALNRSIPGSLCDCGHQACYHSAERKETGGVDRQELEALKEKVRMLEQELERERIGGGGGLVDRLSRLEELVERNRAEGAAETKGVYQRMGSVWHHIGVLNKRTPHYDDNIEGLIDDVQRVRNQLVEVDHASIRVEERVEALETMASPVPILSHRRRASTPPSAITEGFPRHERRSRPPLFGNDSSLESNDAMSSVRSFRERVSSVGSDPEAWTVHISLLPTFSQPFPFEKDTAAYKRCLCRGLHQVIVIPDPSSLAFSTAVSEAFKDILLGREWQPLAARLCDAQNLRGLPMLRQLEDHLLGMDHDMTFLQNNCAVIDDTGKILDLYIAMSDDTLSWAELKDVTPFMPGLEAAWLYDPYLDGPDTTSTGGKSQDTTDKRPAAGDIVPAWSPSLKRSASEISRTSSFSSSTGGDGTRSKMNRQCTATNVDIVGRRAEAV